MTAGPETPEFQKFFQRLIRPATAAAASSEPPPPAVTHVTVNAPMRCKIYIGMPFGATPDGGQQSEPPGQP